MDEGTLVGGSKVNFQKASCTLDASVKIYSHRWAVLSGSVGGGVDVVN